MKTEPSRQARSILQGGAISFIVAMGFGRFAFTPLLPMMLHDHVIDLHGGTFLASIHYIGYLLGACLCVLLPWLLRRCYVGVPSHTAIIRYNLVVIVVLIFGMSLPIPVMWPLFRFLTGIATAIAFIYTSGWCLERLAQLNALSLSGIIYAGPGVGIIISGLISIAMISLHCSSSVAWFGFSLLAACLTALIWNTFQGDLKNVLSPHQVRNSSIPAQNIWTLEPILLSLGYGLAGFGYIITATFLPIIAHETIAQSPWIDFFWPIFGLSVVAGALSVKKIPVNIDRRLLLFSIYITQLLGVLMPLYFSNQWGFLVGIILVGFPLNIISLLGMQEARRLSPLGSTTLMALLTTMYGLGQILGPSVASYFLCQSRTHTEAFACSLITAAGCLGVGACLYLLIKFLFPMTFDSVKNK